MNSNIVSFANLLFAHAYPIYLPLYSVFKGVVDRRERAAIREIVKPGMVVADVGANIGIYSAFLSRLVGPSGHVYAFEPSPQNFARLKERAAKLGNVTAINSAVGEASGSITLYLSSELNVDHQTYDDGSGRQRIEVPVGRLDELIPATTAVDFVKVDVQGYEDSVIKGADRIFSKNCRFQALLEYWPRGLRAAGVDPTAFIQELRSSGFQVTTLDGVDPMSLAGEPEKYFNILIRRREG